MEPDKFERLRPGGSTGRIAHVHLGEGRQWRDCHSPTWYRRYGGGGAIGGWYLLRDMPATADPLGPENLLIFCSSIVGGVDAPALSKHAVLARSPLTGGAGESQSVSPFGPAFKRAGVDALVIHGCPQRPVYLVVADGEVLVKEAGGLWGLEVADAHDRLLELEGGLAHTAIIGKAGENLVRYASIVNDVNFMCCRTGMGAVMGSKRIKAVVALPGPAPVPADSRQFREAVDDFWANRRTNILNVSQEDAGVASWLADTPGSDTWPVVSRNFQRCWLPGIGKIAGERMERDYKTEAPPPPNIEYARRYRVRSGAFATDPRYGGCEVNSIASLGPMLWIDDLEAVLKLSELTYRHGLDPESLGGTLAWAMECVEKRLLTEADFDGIELGFGKAEAAIRLAEAIAAREGVGDILAEGSLRAAERLGRGSRRCVMCCKGKEVPPHEPRNKVGLALAYGAGPIGPDYDVIEHDFDYSPQGFDHVLDNSRAYGMLVRTAETELDAAKVRQVVYLQRWWSGALESLLFDLFGIAPARYMPPARVEQLCRGITGWDLSILEIMLIGERRVVLLQEFNRRAGLGREDDWLPDRFYTDALPEGKYKGAVLDRARYEEALGLYYAMNGWDEQGLPREAKLYELELDWIVEQRRGGKVPADASR